MNKSPAVLWRIGEAWDVHALVTGRRLIRDSVESPHTHGLLGHSVSGALCHAISDALFDASALGDMATISPIPRNVSRMQIRSRC